MQDFDIIEGLDNMQMDAVMALLKTTHRYNFVEVKLVFVGFHKINKVLYSIGRTINSQVVVAIVRHFVSPIIF